MAAMGFFAGATRQTMDLVTSYSPIFLTTGVTMFRSIAVVRIVWEGFKIAFNLENGNKFAELLVLIAVAYSALVYYQSPIWGIGKGLTKIVTDAGSDLAETIDVSNQTAIAERLSDAAGATSGSTWEMLTNGTAIGRYFILEIVLGVMQAAILAVIAAGFIFAGVCVLIGPIFIPFLLVPILQHWAVNWFSTLFQYSMYPVVGNAVVFVVGHVWMNYFSTITFPMSAEEMAASFSVIVTMGLAGVYVITKIPTFTAGLFAGHSGIGTFR